MSPIPFSPLKDDLFFPCKNAQFFPNGAPAAQAALCAEMSRLAYCSVAPDADSPAKLDLAFNQAKIKSVLQGIGYSVSGVFESQGQPSDEGAHCFIAMRNDNQLAVVAFRGTDKNDPSDVAGDLNGLPADWKLNGKVVGKVHAGFNKFYQQVIGGLLPVVQALQCRVLFTGHSLGAALATLLASARKPDALYTFGSPRVGDAGFVTTLQGVNHYRYVDCSDIVTRIPPPLPGIVDYQHACPPLYIFENRNIEFDPSEIRIFADRAAAFLEYPFKYNAFKKDHVGFRELADHAPINYVTAVTAAPATLDGTPLVVKAAAAAGA